MKIVNTQRAITPKVEKPELWFMCSARRLMVFDLCVKLNESRSSRFKIYGVDMKQLLTHKGQ